ncbi:hypothetical protein RN001_011035 [Aquatica leii]|uniref:WH2 domain-containing protein n=1 Tax=Aquatica leii TaxID=1421715 RepID=A0AAN7P7I4_9COLE|nr:hypothetical protein RN001_011035 [Aquatica leii]
MANPHGFDLVPRDVWGARAPKSPEVMKNPVPYVIIHHTYQPGACNTTEECIKAMKSMQDFHQLERNWSDIGYNFAVGGDGKAYVGRGWSLVGAHSPTYNDKSIGICLIGDWRYELPDNKLLDTVHKLIEYGVQIGKIAPNYLLFGHKQCYLQFHTMPAGKGTSNEDRRGSNTVKRETFRPPWVREGSDDIPPKPSNFLSKSKQQTKNAAAEKAEAAKKADENGTTFVKPQLKPVPPKETAKLQSKEVKIPINLKPSLNRTNTIEEKNAPPPPEPKILFRQDSLKKVSAAPKAPPMPPPAPAFPRSTELKPLTDKRKATLDALKARPKVRPDWTAVLKEVESGLKLKHVQCNDRSKPLLPSAKDCDKSQFIYESERSEKDTSHNQLLKEIQGGVALKKVKTNDRSRPILEGLRKFRRQMTIEEQIIKSQSMASIPPEEITDEADELDDIDKVRDDLQSTKQMLALELRNKESMTRENKRLQSRLAQLEAELEKERNNKKSGPVESDDKLVKTLKTEADDARKTAENLEKKYQEAADQLDNTKTELEEIRKQKLMLEKRLQETLTGKRLSICDRKESIRKESESEPEPQEESDSGDSENEEKKERRLQRELKQLRNKLRGYKNKEDNAKKERMALKTQSKRLQQAIKDEKKKYRGLKKEVSKMAALMKEVGDEEEEEDVEDEEKAEESETESESESESESSESEAEKSASEPEDASFEKKRSNLTKRSKKYDGRLNALKKANYMLKTNVERLQDDLNKRKEETTNLQHELDSVLAELG